MANPKKALEELQKKYGVTPTKKEISPVSQATKPATTGDRDKKTTTNNTQSTTTGTKTRAKSAMDDLRKKYQENPGAWASKAEERKAEREKQYGTYDGATGTRKTEQQNDSTLWDVAKSSASSGMWQFNNAVASTLDFVLPTEFMGKADLPSRFSEWTQKNYEQAEKTRAANLSGRSKAAEVASDLGVGVVSAIPNAILAFMSAGASVPAQLGMTAAGTGLTMAVSNAATSMVKNPMYWSSVMQTLGPSYDEAKRNGASDLEAAVTAIVSTGINAGIETAGGLEKLPGELAEEGGSALLKWVQSMGEEGLEEVLQGIASGVTAKVGYDHDKPLFSTGFEPEKKMMEEIGQYGAGNVDLYSRPATSNADGSWSTVAGMSFNIDGKEVLLPTVWTKDGQPYLSENPDEILQHYFETGEYLGIFDTVEEANAYAEKLHKAQEYYYSGKDDAIVNLAGMAEEFLMGAGVAGILGGGQVVGANMLNRMAGNNVSRDINIDVSQADPVMQAALEVVEAEQGVKQNVDTTTESTNRTTEYTNRTTQEPSTVAPMQSQDGVLPADSKLPTRQKKPDRSRPAPNYGKYGTEAFDKIVSETGAEPAAVQRSFETFYQAGLTDIPVEKMRFVNRNQEDAYFAGRRDYALSLGENKQKGATLQGKGGLVQNELSAALDKDTATTLDNMGRATGTKIILDESMRGGDANGRYEKGEIHISPDAEDPVMVVAKHELTHHLQVVAPEAYAAFRSYAIQKMNAATPAGVSTVAEAKQSRYFELSKGNIDLTTEEAMDEVAAELTEYLLSDEKHMREFIDEVSGNAETRTWAQKFFDAVHEFIEKIKRAFGKGDTALADKMAEAKYGMTVKQLEQAEKLWKDAVKAAGENAAIVDKVESVLGHGLKPAQNGSTMDAKYSLKENGNDRRSAENRRERSELESRPGNYEENESIRRFYAEAESRGQTVRVFGGNQKDGGRTSGRPGRFSEVTGDARSENAVATQKELAKLGIESFVHTGDLEILGANGTIYSGGDAGSINKSAVGISNAIKIAPKNTAGHEAFHHWRGRPGRAEYAETVYGGLDWTSEALWGLNDWINKQYFDGKFDPTDKEAKDYKLKLILYKEEMVAYITGCVHNGEDVSDMINNMADAKAMWEAFVAEQVGQNGKKFSLKDSSDLNREIERILTEGKRTKRKAADIQADIRAVVGQTYRAMTDEYGAFEPGEKATRDVQVPKKTGKKEHVSQTVRTVMEAGATPDAALETIEELTARGEFSYERLTNKQAMADAEVTIRHKGYDDALADWTATVSSGQVNAANTAMGWALYNAAVNDSDTKKAMSILSNIIRHQRDAAQAVQATRILKMMGPDATLYGVQRSVDAMMDDLQKKYGDQAPNLKINEELVKRFREAKDDEARDAALKEIYKDIGRQIPSNWMDKWNAWRYMAMLTNPTTHVRNVFGNAFFAPVVATKDLAATTIESAVHFVSGGKVGRTKAMPGRKLLQAAWGDYKNVAEELMAGGKYSDSFMQNQQVQEGRKIFKNRALEAIRKGNSGLMEVEDAWFAQPHYAFALAQYCKANGITAEQLQKGKALGNARAYAIREAQKATYRDTNMFSQTISDLGKYNGNNPVKKGLSMVTEGILPFRKTPANILVRGLEYSPLGLLKGLSYDLFQVKNEKMTAADAIDNISAGLTGTGLLVLGIYMAAEGLVRGSGGEDDDEIEYEELMGHQAYSMELPDGTSATLDWLAPECLPFFVGVNLYEQQQESKENVTLSDILTAASNVTEPMLAMSCLQSLNDVFDSVGYVTSEGLSALPKALASSVTSYLTQAFPTLLGKFERAGEDVRMTTFTEKNAFLTSDLQYTIGSISNRIPGWDYNQIPYIDAWGRTESTGTKGERVVNNFANPAYMSEIQTSPMEEELLRLYEATGEGSVLPNRAQKYFNVDKEKYYLTGEQYVQYATTKGQMSYKMLGELTSDSIYKGLPDEEKVKTVSKIYEYANAKAKTKVSDYVLPAWVQKADKTIETTGISAAKYLAIYQMENNIGSLKQAGETIDNSHGLLVMEMIQGIKGLSDKQRTALYEDLNVGKKVRGYSPAKVKQELEKMRNVAD